MAKRKPPLSAEKAPKVHIEIPSVPTLSEIKAVEAIEKALLDALLRLKDK